MTDRKSDRPQPLNEEERLAAARAFLAEAKRADPTLDLPEAFAIKQFTRTRAMANLLIKLVASGEKTGTASLPWEFEAKPEDTPHVGQILVATDGDGHPKVLLRMTYVETMPFNDVPLEQAMVEGEQIRTVELWRQAHWAYFTNIMKSDGKGAPDEMMPVVCQRFERLYVTPELREAAAA